ncbi:MAG: ABC transporter ATP-binding protein [Finegoldia sp.]|nr:ABC transporter ATP-binding protein [Finegoldia sp.]
MICEARSIEKSFDGKKVLDRVSFSLNKGEIVGLVGRNGSGKTTLLKILSRILDADSGIFTVGEGDLFLEANLIRSLAYFPDRFDYFNFTTVEKAMDYYKLIYPKFNRAFVVNEAKKNKLDLKKTIRTFSKGNTSLIGLLIVLATGADIILCDEILDGMDVINREKIIGYLIDAKEEGRTILLSSHELEELSGITDRNLYLSLDGKLEDLSDKSDENIHKLQVVVKESLPEDIRSRSVIRHQIARVYTILIDIDDREIEKLMDRDEIVLYDELEVLLEDYFYWERGKEC